MVHQSQKASSLNRLGKMADGDIVGQTQILSGLELSHPFVQCVLVHEEYVFVSDGTGNGLQTP